MRDVFCLRRRFGSGRGVDGLKFEEDRKIVQKNNHLHRPFFNIIIIKKIRLYIDHSTGDREHSEGAICQLGESG